MTRFIDTGNYIWIADDDIARVHIEEQRVRHGITWETVYDVVLVPRGATWNDETERWTNAIQTWRVGWGDYWDANTREECAVRIARELVNWLADPDREPAVLDIFDIALADEHAEDNTETLTT